MVKTTLYTICGVSGIYSNSFEEAMEYIKTEHNWYYCKIADDNAIVFEEERPYFVRKSRLLRDNFTGEMFYGSECFATVEEAMATGEKYVVLRGRMAYLELM